MQTFAFQTPADDVAPHLCIGLMSGTSLDGVDAALVEVSGSGARLQAKERDFLCAPMPPELRKRLLALQNGEVSNSVQELARLHVELGELFASAALQLLARNNLQAREVFVIGSHGQTVCHLPQDHASLQIGGASVIAERTGITTVADFRARDLAAEGEGAPLVPYTDWCLLRSDSAHRVVQNIGGIANCTLLPAKCELSQVRAWDTGPGVMLMDACARHFSGERELFDANGQAAKRGHVDAQLVQELLQNPYFARTPPKSAGREEFGDAFAHAFLEQAQTRGLSPDNVLATATALSAASIVDAYARFAWPYLQSCAEAPIEVILCGGGARNPTLQAMLEHELQACGLNCALVTTDELGFSGDAKEAVAFAILAHETLQNAPSNVPGATGATRSVVLGSITPGTVTSEIAAQESDARRERLADFAHERWSRWMRHLFAQCETKADGSVSIPAALAQRWTRQMQTPYDALPETERDSDRTEADELWRNLNNLER